MATNSIDCNYDVLHQVSGDLSALSNELSQMLTQLRGQTEHLMSDGWRGKGSSAFFAEMQDDVLPTCDKFKQTLNNSAQTTKRISTAFVSAEQEAAALFKQG